MPEVAKITVDSKIINRIAKLAFVNERMGLESQVYILVFAGKLMLAAFDGFCLGMREIEFDDLVMKGEEALDAHDANNKAIYSIGQLSWMFPADLKIPNGLIVTITLYDGYEVILKTKNACYGPFDKVKTLDGTECFFDIHGLVRYPKESVGSSRLLSPAKTVKLIAAIADKDDQIILNAHGRTKDKIHIRTANYKGFGMIMPMRSENCFSEEPEEPSNEEIAEDME